MALKMTPAIHELRLTQSALQRHAKVPTNQLTTQLTRGQQASSEMDDSFPSTDPEGAVQTEEMDQILMDPEKQRELLAAFGKVPEFFDVADTVKTPVRESIDLDTRPTYAQPCFLPPGASQVLPEQEKHGIGTRSLLLTPGSLITPPITAAQESPPHSSHDSARLIKTTSAQEDQLRNMLPLHFPRFGQVQNHGELGFYIDRSQYAISVGSGPLDDLQYGIIIVPFGEEHMLFRPECESREVPLATQQESSSRPVDEVQPRIINSASRVPARESSTNLATLSKVRAPPKRTQNSGEKSSRVKKATRTRNSQTPAPICHSQRLNAGRRST